MRIEHKDQKEIESIIINILKKYLNLDKYKIFFFGSRVSDKGNEYSDIDVGIEGNKKIPHKTFIKIKEDIENLPILYKIDIVDFKRISEDFVEIAKQNIEEIKI